MRIILLFIIISAQPLFANILHVGEGREFSNPRLACLVAKPGDTVLIHNGIYQGAFFIENIQGTEKAPIVIRGEDRDSVRFQGGSESFHFSDCSYMIIENFTINGQTSNGMNCDDAGTYDTPTHHMTFRKLRFTGMGATGNNDQLKLSGLDEFTVEDCIFENGSPGGSGADMVGCHKGIFKNNAFRKSGSNCIQAKGGTSFIRIERNSFIDGGQRALNLGGSTGLEFFRPLDAKYEAADLSVTGNVFVGSVTPMAYVGSVRVSVTNNTIINPERWVFRILQETVDPNRFLPCGENLFQNNLIVFKSTISRHVNIGGNTAPQTFLLRNNLWYNVDNPSASKMQEAQLTELNGIYGIDPLLRDYAGGDYRLTKDSPAKGKGYSINDIGKDNEGKPFGNPPSIGAYEIEGITSIEEVMGMQSTVIRTAQGIWVKTASNLLPKTVEVFNLRGEHIRSVEITQEQQFIPLEHYQFIMQ
ncbi:MAG: right-handed parallel beta-helix repeat-containing protein [Bacteroidota bacterium]